MCISLILNTLTFTVDDAAVPAFMQLSPRAWTAATGDPRALRFQPRRRDVEQHPHLSTRLKYTVATLNTLFTTGNLPPSGQVPIYLDGLPNHVCVHNVQWAPRSARQAPPRLRHPDQGLGRLPSGRIRVRVRLGGHLRDLGCYGSVNAARAARDAALADPEGTLQRLLSRVRQPRTLKEARERIAALEQEVATLRARLNEQPDID